MASHHLRQYQPLGDGEFLNYNAFSTRIIRDLTDGINNAAHWVFNHKIISQYWPSGVSSGDGSTNAFVGVIFPPLYVPTMYNAMRFHVVGKRAAGAAAITVTLYSSDRLYSGTSNTGGTISDRYIGARKQSGSVTIDSDTAVMLTSTCNITRTLTGNTYLTMVLTNADTDTRGYVYAIDVTPQVI